MRIGLHIADSPQKNVIQREWNVSFAPIHHSAVLRIVQTSQMVMPNQPLLDGAINPPNPRDKGQRTLYIFTSPSINYCEMNSYCKVVKFRGVRKRAMIACQLRQDPRQMVVQRETMLTHAEIGSGVVIDRRFHPDMIEWKTSNPKSTMVYGLLIKLTPES